VEAGVERLRRVEAANDGGPQTREAASVVSFDLL
jgi:hypothetical protein